MHNLPSKYCKTSCFFDDQAKTVTAWLGSTDSSTVFTSHCTFGFLCILVFTKFFNGKNFSSREDYISVLVAQLCLTFCDLVDCSPSGSCVHEIFQARILEWVAISFSRGSSWPRDQTPDLLHCRQILYRLNYKGSPEDYKGTWNNTLLKKIKDFKKMELRSCLKKMAGGSGTKRWILIHCSIKLLMKMKNLSFIFT